MTACSVPSRKRSSEAVGVGFDEALFEVGVDDACGSGGFGAAADGPGADLLDAGGEVGDEVEQAVGGVDEAVEAGLLCQATDS